MHQGDQYHLHCLHGNHAEGPGEQQVAAGGGVANSRRAPDRRSKPTEIANDVNAGGHHC
jgi:hypothetical protein